MRKSDFAHFLVFIKIVGMKLEYLFLRKSLNMNSLFSFLNT